MVAKIDLDASANRIEREEDVALAAGLDQRREETPAETMRSHGVVEEAYFHALSRLFRQQLHELPAEVVGLKDEVLEVNVMLRLADRLHFVIESWLAFVV